MSPDRAQFLNLARTPGRLTAEEAAWYLGFSLHDLPVLVAHKLLKPLGNPPTNGTRYFAGADLETCRLESKWLDKASATLVKHWKDKNKRRSNRFLPGASDRV
jgi:hypothetical protein